MTLSREIAFFKESSAERRLFGDRIGLEAALEATFVESSGVMSIWGLLSFILSVIAFANAWPMEFIKNDEPGDRNLPEILDDYVQSADFFGKFFLFSSFKGCAMALQ